MCAHNESAQCAQIAGSDSFRLTHGDPIESRGGFLVDFINKVRSLRHLRSAVVVLAIETNLGVETGTLSGFVRTSKLLNIHHYVDEAGTPGITATNQRKMTMLYATRTLFTFGSVYTLREWANVSKKDSRAELHAQLTRVHPVVLSTKTASGTTRWGWSGKSNATGGGAGGAQDDMAVALMMSLYLMEGIVSGYTTVPSTVTGEKVYDATLPSVKSARKRTMHE